MASNAVYNAGVVVESRLFSQARTVEGDGSVIQDPTLAVAKAGTLTVRTNSTTGTLTMSTGHGIQTGDRLDLFWSGGSKYGLTVGTVSGNSVPFTGVSSGGDALPDAASTISAMVPILRVWSVDGDTLQGLYAKCDAAAMCVFVGGDQTTFLAYIPIDPTDNYVWDTVSGGAGLLDGLTSGYVYLSHGDISLARQVTVIGLVTP